MYIHTYMYLYTHACVYLYRYVNIDLYVATEEIHLKQQLLIQRKLRLSRLNHWNLMGIDPCETSNSTTL
jgi:hypothetical protein